MQVEGKCHCGKIAYEATVDPDTVLLCHCTDCQTLTGSPFRANIQAPAASFVLLLGEPKIYTLWKRPIAETCPDCGTPIYASAISNPPSYSLRVGSIQQRKELNRPKRQIWCRSALSWSMDLNGVEKVDRQ